MKKQRGIIRFFSLLTLIAMLATGSVSAFAAPIDNLDADVFSSTVIEVSPRAEEDSAPLNNLMRGTLSWSNQTINYDTRMRFVSSYTDGYFTLDGVTATFTVTIANGASETIEIDWCDSNGNVTKLYSGTTNSKTVSYTSSGRVSGNFRVWNKSVAAIKVNASISY